MRVLLVLGVACLVLFMVWWGIRWLVRNQVRITIRRAPTDKELMFLAVAVQMLKTLVRFFLRR
jgi:hypothetical protein